MRIGKISLIVNLSLLVLLVGGAIFVLTKNISHENKNLFLDVGNEESSQSLITLEDVNISSKISYGSRNYREMRPNSPVYLSIEPSAIESPINGTLEIKFFNMESDLYLDNKLIFPGLKNYKRIKEFEDSYLYQKNKLSFVIQKTLDSKSLSEFIKENYYGPKVYSFTINDKLNPQINNFDSKTTNIDTLFRGNVEFLSYNEGDLYINFTKKDINAYKGEDEYTLKISELNGTIIYQEKFLDDGDTSNLSIVKGEKKYSIYLPNLNGFYILSLTNVEDNSIADSIIGNISINTNKIIIRGDFLVVRPFSFYIKNDFPQNISFYYWRKGGSQTIKVFNNNFIEEINLSDSYRGKNFLYDVVPNENKFVINKSYIWVLNDFAVSPSKENWFDVPITFQQYINDPDLIVLDKKKIFVGKDYISIRERITLNETKNRFLLKVSGDKNAKLDSVQIMLD